MRCPRRLTADERDRRDALHAERYEALTVEVEAEQFAEYERSFGDTYKSKHPYRINSQRVHDIVERRLKAEEQTYNESRAENER